MVIAVVDIETYRDGKPILDSNAFVLGCYLEEKKKPKYFKKPRDMWIYILARGRQLYAQKKKLNIYAHNHWYDFLGYADYLSPNIFYYSDDPFIVTYRETGHDIVHFLDTFAIFQTSLLEIGHLMGLQKGITPQLIQEARDLVPYITRDCEITLKVILDLKRLLREDDVYMQRLYTINQIGIQYFLSEMKSMYNMYFFEEASKNIVHKTRWQSKIHEAYRGARVECFKTGRVDKVTYIDINSLYPYICLNMNFPDLRSQRQVHYPHSDVILNQNGLARCIVYNNSDDLGFLPVRTPEFSYYPKKDKFLIGTWTFDELRYAINHGYKLLSIQWAIIYGSSDVNPYKLIIPKLYKKRMQTTNNLYKVFYKSVMNRHLGKLAQKRPSIEMNIQDVNVAIEYVKKGWQQVKGITNTTNVLIKKESDSYTLKPYYAPIIPTLVNARARIFMHKMLSKIPLNDLVYTDTDSILFQGDHLSKFQIGLDLGQFKVEHREAPCLIWGKKSYSIGSDIKLAGIHKANLNKADFELGLIKSKTQYKLKNTNDTSKIGTFYEQERNLTEVLTKHLKIQELMSNNQVFVDDNLLEQNMDLSFFYDKLKGFLKDPYSPLQ